MGTLKGDSVTVPPRGRSKAWKVCAKPGCNTLTKETYCDAHKPKDERPSRNARGYNYQWTKARKLFLIDHPFCNCNECKESGHPLPANVVDHIIPHKGDMRLFWDVNNWQAMNKRCHDKKTAREDGGFGRKRKIEK